jgi:serine/threonine protein kinase
MELVQSTSLVKAMKSPSRPTDQWIACLMMYLCITIRELHRFSVIHRDLKPANVTLCVDGRAMLLDLVLARDLGTTGPGITKGKQAPGAPAYMSPEQIKGAPVSVRTDVYELGVLLHELVSGTRPFVGEKIYLLYAHVFEGPLSLHALRPEVDPRLCGLAAAMLAKRADSRPGMGEVLDRLAELLPPSGFGHVEAPDFPPLIEHVRPLAPKAVPIGAPQPVVPGDGAAARVRAADALYDAGRALEAFAQYEVLALELAHGFASTPPRALPGPPGTGPHGYDCQSSRTGSRKDRVAPAVTV